MRNDPKETQGIPDLLILYNNRWGMLEVKLDDAPKQSNQAYYVERFASMSFASFISPETEEEVLYALQLAFGLVREARVS